MSELSKLAGKLIASEERYDYTKLFHAKYEAIDFQSLRMERPEYILKDGKAFNIYGALKDLQEMQEKLREMDAKLNS